MAKDDQFKNNIATSEVKNAARDIDALKKIEMTGSVFVSDSKLMLEESINNSAMLKAYEKYKAEFENANTDAQHDAAHKKYSKEVTALQTNPAFVASVKKEFDALEKAHPDGIFGDDTIDIEQASLKKIEALGRDFPSEMASWVQGIDPNVDINTPSDLLQGLANAAKKNPKGR